jgi:hypothetical protein
MVTAEEMAAATIPDEINGHTIGMSTGVRGPGSQGDRKIDVFE